MQYDGDFYKSLLNNMYDGVYVIDTKRKITFWNTSAEKLTGYKASEVIGKFCREQILMHVDDRGKNLCKIQFCPASRAIEGGETCEEELYLHHKDGHRVPVFSRISPLRDQKGRIIGAVEIFHENSSGMIIRQKMEELQKLALVDPVTEIGNRRYAEANLYTRIDEMQRYGWPFGVLFIDIDHFKVINDIHGHDTGDKILRMVARTLSNCVRSMDTVSRWGGEEFIAFIINIKNQEKLFSIANKCRTLVEESSLINGEDPIKVTVSIGATLAKPDDTSETLLNRADQLMYQSKTDGRNKVSINIKD